MKETLLELVKNRQPPFKVKIYGQEYTTVFPIKIYNEYKEKGYFVGNVKKVLLDDSYTTVFVEAGGIKYPFMRWADYADFELVEEDYMGWPCYL